jgi:hypothetical protein
MSDCEDPDCGEHIKCKNCGDTTNHCPDYFPRELDGYCPSCAVDGMEAGVLPKPDKAAMLEYILGAIANRLGEGIALKGSADPGWKPVGPASETGQAFVVTQCLN